MPQPRLLPRVDGLALFLWSRRFGSTTASTADGRLAYAARFDLNGDGAINGLDIFRFGQHFGETCQ